MVSPQQQSDRGIGSKVGRLVDLLERALREGQFVAGDRFLSTYKIGEKYGVSQGTARKAMSELAARGYLEASERSGYFVRVTPKPLLVASSDPVLLVIVGGDATERILNDYVVALQQSGQRLGWRIAQVANDRDEIEQAIAGQPVVGCLAYDLNERPAVDIDLAATILWSKAHYWRDSNCSIMGIDSDNATQLAYGHLWDLGHQRTAMVRLKEHHGLTANTTGFVLGMRRAYAAMSHDWSPDDVILVTADNLPHLYDYLCASGITGIVCGEWSVTTALYEQARCRNEQIGDRLSIVYIGGHDQLHTLKPTTTRICWRAIDYATTVTDALLQSVQGRPMPPTLRVPVLLEEGLSTRPVFDTLCFSDSGSPGVVASRE